MMLRMFISVSLCKSLCMFTAANTLFMSKATATVSCASLGLLKPFGIWWQMLCNAECVEWLCLNPCGSKMIGMFFAMYGLVFWQWVTEMIWIGSLCQYCRVYLVLKWG